MVQPETARSFGPSTFGEGWVRLGQIEDEIGGGLPGPGHDPLVELRRGYHDRIADVRRRSAAVLRSAIEGTQAATERLSGHGNGGTGRLMPVEEIRAVAAAVDAEVISLLALESPMARDLRVILAARDVTQIGLLCVGLAADLGRRVGRVADTVGEEMRHRLAGVATATDGLLRESEAVWLALDEERALRLPVAAEEGRAIQTEMVAALIGLTGIPMEAAIDLAMVARVYERLTDHALEIAERVVFAVLGPAGAPV